MQKSILSPSQKRHKPTSLEKEVNRAKVIYKSLITKGHMSTLQLRHELGGISESTFYLLVRGILREKPYVGLVRWEPLIKKWYSPQREHYEASKDQWLVKSKFRDDSDGK